MLDDFDLEPTLGFVVEADRGSLPFALIHGESLVACAAWALGDAGVDIADFSIGWAELAQAGLPVVLHDVLCPMTPAEFIAEAVEHSAAHDVITVGVRPVTDTIKTVADAQIGENVDREQLWQVCSPLVLPPTVVEALGEGPVTTSFAELVDVLARQGFEIQSLEAPAQARRVATLDDVRLLEALTAPTKS